MEPSLINAAAREKSPSLWAVPLALIQNQTPNRFLDGIALPATPPSGCAPVLSGSLALHPSIPRKLSPPISRPFQFLPAAATDGPGPAPGSLPSYQCRVVIEANPTMSATPTTARATAVDSAIPSHRQGVRTARRSRVPSRPQSNVGRVLQGLLPPRTIGVDVANPAVGSSCGRNPGTDTAVHK
jgi:hypothetical protein